MTAPPDNSHAFLDAQRQRWESIFSAKPAVFGDRPSAPALAAADLCAREGAKTILELGAGQGRDSMYFARRGFSVTALEYSKTGVETILKKARSLGLLERIAALCHDVREPLPFQDQSFDACYSHMLYCMALETYELERLSSEVRRILKPNGLQVYTVRTTEDPQFGTGTPRGENLYEIAGGFIVRFFDEETVRSLAKGYELVSLDRFDEGSLPRKLFRVTLRRQ